jgi:hypothetical protein
VIIQLTPFGKTSSIAMGFNSFVMSMVSPQTLSLIFRITNFLKFLGLWKIAAPGLHEVMDAKRRLGGQTGT